MRISGLILLLATFFAGCAQASGQEAPVIKETFLYAVKDGDSLYLDAYAPATQPGSPPRPCVIFVFGGGFWTGSKDLAFNVEYMQRLARLGYVGVAIDYRLGMEGVLLGPDNPQQAILARFGNALSMAVEDLLDATVFVLKHTGEWNVDPAQIVANGSSAGALTVLQAEYSICNGDRLARKLPASFNFGGVVAFAGALFTADGREPQWARKPAPIQLFHGDADRNVAYGKADTAGFGLYGSAYIAAQLDRMQSPYHFYDVKNAAHEIAGYPMVHNLQEIDSFIQAYVVRRQPMAIHTEASVIGSPVQEKDFRLTDYMRNNYSNR